MEIYTRINTCFSLLIVFEQLGILLYIIKRGAINAPLFIIYFQKPEITYPSSTSPNTPLYLFQPEPNVHKVPQLYQVD